MQVAIGLGCTSALCSHFQEGTVGVACTDACSEVERLPFMSPITTPLCSISIHSPGRFEARAALPETQQYLLVTDCASPGQPGTIDQKAMVTSIAERLGTGEV
eukprot:scaffold187294_cov17-Tisochrysis_lutea.AAC.1